MVKIISFEGCVGAGKTSLTNYFSYELSYNKILEEHEKNPFLRDFYDGSDVTLEAEITFLLIHYYQIKNALKKSNSDVILCDFSIEKDLVYAELNLDKDQYKIFSDLYTFLIDEVGYPELVIYADLSLNILKRRIFQRGRQYELGADPEYFKSFNDKIKNYFENRSKSNVFSFIVDDLDLEPENQKLCQIREKLLEFV